MRTIVILGAGAIGCFVGGKLAAAGHRVVFVGRPKTVDSLQSNGLVLTQFDGPDTVLNGQDIEATSDAAALANASLVLVCVKSQDTENAAREIAAHSAGKATVISLQNGVSNARILGRHLDRWPIAAGCVQFNVVVGGNGRFHRATEGGIIVKDTPITRGLTDDLNASGISTAVHSDMQAILWAKLLLNLNNGLNALADVPITQQLSNRSYRLVLALLVEEALSALHAAHIRPAVLGKVRPRAIPFFLRLPTWMFRRAAATMLAIDPQARSSMWEDLRANRSSEIDFLNGAVVSLAQEMGTRATANQAIIRLVKDAFEAGRSPGLSGEELLRLVKG